MSGPPYSGTYVALSGGVGGAKLALGLSRLLSQALSVAVNTGDDFDHLGLRICPDIDSVLYKLAGLSDEQRDGDGPARPGTSPQALAGLGGKAGSSSAIKDPRASCRAHPPPAPGRDAHRGTAHVAHQLGVASHTLPMSDDPVSTEIDVLRGAAALPALLRRAPVPAGPARLPLCRRARRRLERRRRPRGRRRTCAASSSARPTPI